ncbi:hypothetical protein [Mastigocoleus sp. MO_188.B34]|uniref:hypothetical protein n=1 Tax=Mastigocoleus sp. MO_188.B34 TaxID=3036635 RepID=UPI0026192B45|nr:hypothetical protein [Mastigocoleus sp. MO_188.B34]MDJ0696108.1 hypothetical protein [Mastigocoleus sp. MO_188.B34]
MKDDTSNFWSELRISQLKNEIKKLEREIKEIQDREAKQSESGIKGLEFIKQTKINLEKPIINEPNYPNFSFKDEVLEQNLLEENQFSRHKINITIPEEETVINDQIYTNLLPDKDEILKINNQFPPYRTDTSIPSSGIGKSKQYPTKVSNTNFITILLWLAAFLLAINSWSQQNINEKEQQKNKQGYLQRNVPVVLDTQTASFF